MLIVIQCVVWHTNDFTNRLTFSLFPRLEAFIHQKSLWDILKFSDKTLLLIESSVLHGFQTTLALFEKEFCLPSLVFWTGIGRSVYQWGLRTGIGTQCPQLSNILQLLLKAKPVFVFRFIIYAIIFEKHFLDSRQRSESYDSNAVDENIMSCRLQSISEHRSPMRPLSLCPFCCLHFPTGVQWFALNILRFKYQFNGLINCLSLKHKF